MPDELDRLGAQARAAVGLRPRLPVSRIADRGRRRRNRHRLAAAGATVAVIALAGAAGAQVLDRSPSTTTVVGQAGPAPSPVPPPLDQSRIGPAPLALTIMEPLDAGEPFPSSIFGGTLVMEDGCVFLRTDVGERRLLIWKAGHWLDTGGPEPLVRGPDGAVIGGAGAPVRLGGGESPGRIVDEVKLVGLRRACVTPKVMFASALG